MSMKADEIEKAVKEILDLKDKIKREQLDEIFLEFRTRNRMFYEVIVENQFNPEIFKEMMKRKRELENGTEQYAVDVKFGRFMAEKFIDPVVKK